MFTGQVREIGRLESVRISGDRAGLEISAPRTAPDLGVGDSLAVNGVCLTVTSAAGARVRADVSTETRRVTTVSNWRAGDRVHLEPALRVGDAVGGHFVLGHVDGVGRVQRVARLAGGLAVTVSADSAILDQLLPKGSIAVDGVSLTLDEGPFIEDFSVTLIPHTLRETRFAKLGPGDLVNLEVDILSKAARRVVGAGTPRAARQGGTLTVEAIAARGWTGRRGERTT
jgi:riboflavin synthase alpha subunit